MASLARSVFHRAARSVYGAQEKLRGRPMEFLFILGHMRTSSTVLVHILSSHPEIAGVGEMHLSYRTPADFEDLVFQVKWTRHELRLRERYVIDKILTPGLEIEDECLHDPRVRYLFLTRNGPDTLESMIRLYRDTGMKTRGPEHCAEYLELRCQQLVEFAHRIGDPKRMLYFTQEEFMADTPGTLAALGRYLELKEPLSEEYKVHRATGRRHIGDTSKYIHAGKVVHERKKDRVEVDPVLEEHARLAVEACEQELRRCCTGIVVGERQL